MITDEETSPEILIQNFIDKNQSDELIEYLNINVSVEDFFRIKLGLHSQSSKIKN